ncbi:TauD/TfdA dioxygenase family protein [Acinetobacter zhairhuonensis]|uniref:TauD/TfdA dioxygenase family protein n=1 Tax=Acinetobacter sp. A7.4 TaxID=2919921 RepID=UPI001F4D9E14|nr:TauD/TfdA family dioxygenase [Acinetobacter sp. A7.4]MCJ8160510.1 TauD/TfdA family dioxygenase [Acinetobacter sp. A7.4]
MTSLTQLSQAIHDAPQWHIPDAFQASDEIQISPLQDKALGAIVTGLNARKAQSGKTIYRLKQALAEHLILIFKKQSLDDLQFLAFASYFGAIFRPSADNPVLASQSGTGTPPDVVPVSNAVGQGDYTGHGELSPHADHQWTPLPSFGSLLYAIELPQSGGETSWYNTIKAYDALDPELKTHIDQLQLITYNPFVRANSNKGSNNYANNSPYYRFKDQPILGHAYPHPLVRTHPETGRKALWLNTRSEVELLNYDDVAGSELIAQLRKHILKPEFRYDHQWETGDIVFWDNQVTLHSRTPFPANQRRLLKRISLAGARPF